VQTGLLKMSSEQRLRITEIFYSLQGESLTAGIPTTFIRLTGCPLRCDYCDTAYAFSGGQWMSFDQILDGIAANKTTYITVTGGEPLAQKPCLQLLSELCDRGYTVSLETSGALSVQDVDARVVKVMDIKTPDSGESGRNLYENLQWLDNKDQIKLVICSRADYDWARERLQQYNMNNQCEVLFSPVHGRQSARELAEWILRDNLPVRLQLQLHKLLWGGEPGR
jgi:7-carboxy-7-deazaguanine synthase